MIRDFARSALVWAVPLLVLLASASGASADPPATLDGIAVNDCSATIFDISGTYTDESLGGDEIGLDVNFTVAVDANGGLTGSGLLSDSSGEEFEGVIAFTVTGKLKGNGLARSAKLILSGEGTITIDGVSVFTRIKIVENATLDPCTLLTTGKVTARAAFPGAGIRPIAITESFSEEPLDTPVGREPLTGAWRLGLDLATDLAASRLNISGNAMVAIDDNPGRVLDLDATGKYNAKKDSSNVKALGAGDAFGAKLAVRTLMVDGGTATAALIKYKALGQRGQVVIGP